MEDGDGVSTSKIGPYVDMDAKKLEEADASKCILNIESIVPSKSYKESNVNVDFNSVNGECNEKIHCSAPENAVSLNVSNVCVNIEDSLADSKQEELSQISEISSKMSESISIKSEVNEIPLPSDDSLVKSDEIVVSDDMDKSVCESITSKPREIPILFDDSIIKSDLMESVANISEDGEKNNSIITNQESVQYDTEFGIVKDVPIISEDKFGVTSQDSLTVVKEQRDSTTTGESSKCTLSATDDSDTTFASSVDQFSSGLETADNTPRTDSSESVKEADGEFRGRTERKSHKNKLMTQESIDKNKPTEIESRMCDRTRSSRKKSEEKSGASSSDGGSSSETHSFQYSGFKNNNVVGKITANVKNKNSPCRWNPFNPAWKRNFKSGKQYFIRQTCKNDLSCSTLQPEYAQYLGLQPIVKFRCSNCGMSTFQSMSALNTHQVECKKNGRLVSVPNDIVSSGDVNSANIKLTRKVFLCSTCGTYYENCDLFLHMREYHRRFICLFCLHMTQTPESLDDHLRDKHKVTHQNYTSIEELQKVSTQSFYLLCLRCDKVFTEMDDSSNHKCIRHSSKSDSSNFAKKQRLESHLSSQDSNGLLHSHDVQRKHSVAKLSREVRRKSPIPLVVSESNLSQSCANALQCTEVFPKDQPSESFHRMEVEPSPSSVQNEVCKAMESFQLQVPKGIEIKPLLPGDKTSEDLEPKNDKRPGVEIFPIPLSESKNKRRSERPKTIVLRRPMKRRRSSSASKKKESLISETNEPMESPVPIMSPVEPEISIIESDTVIPSAVTVTPVSEMPPSLPDEKPVPLENNEETGEHKEIEQSKVSLKDSEVGGDPVEVPKEQSEEKQIKSDDGDPEVVDDQSEVFQEPVEESGAEQNENMSVEEVPKPEEKEITSEEQSENVVKEQDEVNMEQEYDNRRDEEEMISEKPAELCSSLPREIIKLKLPGQLESDGESDDSQKLSLVVDENTNNSDIDTRKNDKEDSDEMSKEEVGEDAKTESDSDNIQLAREDVAAMALTLDDKIENVSVQLVLKECVRTSCLSCNYCRHAVRIAVNGKQLALHLLSEHRYTPVKNETSDDVVRKLKHSLEELDQIYLNTESYDSSDPAVRVPYDKESTFDCFQCNYAATDHKDLYAHKKKFHTKSLLLCIMCKVSFHCYSELIGHLCRGYYVPGTSLPDVVFRCCFCSLDNIPSAFRLMVHLRKSHHTCDICLEICVDQQKLSTHMWKHKLNHLCYRCGIAYASKPDITKHLFWKHGTESVLCKKCLQKKWPHVYHFCIPPTSFNCEECNISFSKAVALKVHKRIHGNDYPYACTICEKKFVSKKLLSRHIDRHNAIAQRKESKAQEEPKDEIINVTDVLPEEKETSHLDNSDSNKDPENTETKDKCHRKHKKDKEKKEKKVVDVYDLPPLNLSSESDSSEEEDSAKTVVGAEVKQESDDVDSLAKSEDVRALLNDKAFVAKALDETKLGKAIEGSLGIIDKDTESSETKSTTADNVLNNELIKAEEGVGDSFLQSLSENSTESNSANAINNFLPLIKEESKPEINPSPGDHVEGIWENFYRTNSQNPNLPYPLCAMKSEEAYNIIMGDHDYCQQSVVLPTVKEILPSTGMLETPSLSDDKLEETTPAIIEKTQTPSTENEIRSATPSSAKKKFKSPKKKTPNKTSDNNSSSSSDSSSDTDSSSCSCGTNCSCSSSNSSSSSSSSSDSDSSSPDDKLKQEKRKKRREKKGKVKAEDNETKETSRREEVDVIPPPEPEDPPIRESELETDESTSDEEFYDKEPQKIANQMAEKRQSLLLGTNTPINNGSASPLLPLPQPQPLQEVVVPPVVLETPKQKIRTKRRKKPSPKLKPEKVIPSVDVFSKFTNSTFHQNTVTPKQKSQQKTPTHQNPLLASEAGGSGSETDNTRLSKRRRRKNKFYGYSSGEEEDKEKMGKWKKTDFPSVISTPKYQQPTSTTPRIQLTVPKQVIRKPTYHKVLKQQQQQQLLHQQQVGVGRGAAKVPSTSDTSSDSDTDIEERVPRPPAAAAAVAPTALVQETQHKTEKDVYCYCRCPYDEVSEMIACDDKNCKIEWFHFECVGILVPPRGQWFCPGCRKARGLPT